MWNSSPSRGVGGDSASKGPDLKKIRDMAGIKTFEDLKIDVIDRGLCSMCRGCVTFCSASTLEAISILKGKPDYVNLENCLSCGICYSICPRTSPLEKNLREAYGYKMPIGTYHDAYSLRTTDLQIQEVCTDGGFVTGFLKYLMDEKVVDSALICKREGIWSSQPMVAMSFKYLLKGAGSSMTVSSSIEDLDIYTTYIPSLLALKGMGDFPTRLAVVGTPCQISTIRKMQLLKIVPSNIVGFTVGLFCYENFHFTEKGRRALEAKIGANLSEVEKINVKDAFLVTLKSGEVRRIDLDNLQDLVRPECLPCTDFTNYSADVSVGGLGSGDGYTTVLVRSDEARGMVERAIERGYFAEDKEFEKETSIRVVENVARRKHERGLKKLKELGIEPDSHE